MSNALPEQGWLRLKQILGDKKSTPPIPPIIPVAPSTWWAGCKTKRWPAPQYPFGPGLPLWRAESIRALLKPVAEGAT